MSKKKRQNITFDIKLVLLFSIMLSALLVGALTLAIVNVFFLDDIDLIATAFVVGIPLVVSSIVSIFFAITSTKRRFYELNIFLKALDKVSQGDFDVYLDNKGIKTMVPVYDRFNAMVKELQSIGILRNDFISNFSHEFKTPIVSIKGFANLAKDQNISDKEREEYLDIIIKEIDRLVALSNQTLLLTELESKEIIIDKKLFSLDEQIRQAIVLLQNEWEEKNIELSIDLDEISIISNQNLLQQLWLNIFSNAIKYNNIGGKIDVILKENDNETIKVIVRDNGIGISEETIQYIFNKFYQADKSRKSEGLGLGLSIAKRIITLCDGTINVESKKDEGTTFYIILPKGAL